MNKSNRNSFDIGNKSGFGDKCLRHVAIIMDGNGRWARSKSMPRMFGHQKGVNALRRTLKCLYNMEGVNTLSVFAFSAENWKRPKEEVNGLINLIRMYVNSEIDELDKKGVRLTFMGDLTPFPKDVQEIISAARKRTENNKKFTLNVGINYGGRQEILRAVQRMLIATVRVDTDEKDRKGIAINADNLQLDDIEKFLDTSVNNISSPDLVIRTSGEKRVSNFMLWQMAYAELYFSDVMWPDFDEQELLKAIDDFHKRDRRFGAVKDPAIKVN